MTTSAAFIQRLHNYDDNYLLTRAEVARITGRSASTLCAHSYAGLLPFIPGRPVHVRVGDLKVYLKMMANGVRQHLHPSMRVEHADRQAYSPLHGVSEFTREKPADMIATVVKETGFLWAKYKEARKHKDKKAKRKKRVQNTLSRGAT